MNTVRLCNAVLHVSGHGNVMQHTHLTGMAQAWTHRRKVARVQRRLLGMLHSLAREVCSRCAPQACHC